MMVYFLLFLIGLSLSPAEAQNKEISRMEMNHYLFIPPDQDPLLKGPVYNQPPFTTFHHPFLGKNEWNKCAIILNQYGLADTLMAKYDVLNDLLVTYVPMDENQVPYVLNSHEIKFFKLLESTFGYISNASLNDIKMKPGFYEEAFNDEVIKLWIKHVKEIKPGSMPVTYTYSQTFILQNNLSFYVIRGKRTLLRALSIEREELGFLLGQSGYSARPDKRESLCRLLRTYIETR